MIILTLGGGLGNQMFQYAYARKLQMERKDEELRFSVCRLPQGIGAERILFRLNIAQGIDFLGEAEEENMRRYLNRRMLQKRVLHKLSRWIPGISAGYLERQSEKGFYADDTIYDRQKHRRTQKETRYVMGGFQNPRYWEEIQEQIRRELKVKEAPTPANLSMMEQMQGCESVCVHIRRGDYLAPEYRHLNICDEAYYRKAMQSMLAQKPDAVFYIFTNTHEDIAWIRENYHLEDFPVRYVDLGNPDYEELRLMYSCRNFIISNSTFSWWGQFLSDASDKIVIAPDIWNRELDASGIYMDSWQLVHIQ